MDDLIHQEYRFAPLVVRLNDDHLTRFICKIIIEARILRRDAVDTIFGSTAYDLCPDVIDLTSERLHIVGDNVLLSEVIKASVNRIVELFKINIIFVAIIFDVFKRSYHIALEGERYDLIDKQPVFFDGAPGIDRVQIYPLLYGWHVVLIYLIADLFIAFNCIGQIKSVDIHHAIIV